MFNLSLFVASISLAVATASLAQVHGHLQDIIEDARENLDPPYVKDLMDDLAKELLVIAEGREIRGEQERLAWFLTMAAVVDATLDAAQVIAQIALCSSSSVIPPKAALKLAVEIALNSAQKVAGDVPLDIARERANCVAENNISWRDIYTEITSVIALGSTYEEGKRIAYRIAEWRVLNWLLENIQAIVAYVYPTTYAFLTFNIRPNPFASDRALCAFMHENFENQRDEVMFFFAPWLVPITHPNVIPDSQHVLFKPLIDLLLSEISTRLVMVDEAWA
jgi:hypothetical protein